MSLISPILRPSEVVKRFGISQATLCRYRQQGIGPDYIHYPASNPGGKGSFGYKLADLERWLETCRRSPRRGKVVASIEEQNGREFYTGL